MKELEQFKIYWNDHYGHISLELTNRQILEYLHEYEIPRAADLISDYLLSQGLADVQE